MSTEVGLARSVDFARFYSRVLMNPMPSMARYTKYITVKPKLLRLHAPYIKNTVAIKKNM